MPIDYYGFLGKDIEAFKTELSAKYKEVFEFFEEFNHFLHKMKFDLKPKSRDERAITIVALFIKSLETFQSVYILVKHCLSIDAENLTRVLFEEMVKIGYCSRGEDEFTRYMCTHFYRLIKLINAAQSNPAEFPEELFQKKSLNKIKEEVQGLLAKVGNPSEISIENMARELGIIKIYNSYYRTVCVSVHSEPKALEKYMITGKDGSIEGFLLGPRIEGIIQNVFTAIEFMLLICDYLSNFFGVPKKEDISDLNSRKDKLFKKYE